MERGWRVGGRDLPGLRLVSHTRTAALSRKARERGKQLAELLAVQHEVEAFAFLVHVNPQADQDLDHH